MLSRQIAAPECLKDCEPIIQGQVPWRVCEWLAAGKGGQERGEAEVHRLGIAQPGNVPHPGCHWAGWGLRIVVVVECFHGPPTTCLDFLVPLKLSLSIACGPRLGDLPGPCLSPWVMSETCCSGDSGVSVWPKLCGVNRRPQPWTSVSSSVKGGCGALQQGVDG